MQQTRGTDSIVQVSNLRKQYNSGGVVAVENLSFDVRRGEIFSLLGPNGSGKTTTISLLSGLLTATDGDVVIDGHSINAAPVKAKEVIGVVPDEIALYPTISARENLTFWGKMYGIKRQRLKDRVAYVLDVVGLKERAEDKVENYSGGMKRRLNIAVGLLHEPKLLLMDEPTVGIDPQSRRRILDTVKELNAQGMTVLYTTHYMEEAEELSHRIGIIDHGKLIAVGTQSELDSMVGEYDTIKIQVNADGSTQRIADALVGVPGVHRIDSQNSHLILQARDAGALLSNVVAVINKEGAGIKHVEIREPDLEAVFLHLTGRVLRD